MGYYFVLPGNEPKAFSFGDADMKVSECTGKSVQVGVPAILPDGGYTKEYIWVYVLSIVGKGSSAILCGETLHDMVHEAPLKEDGVFAWVSRRDGIPKHTDKYKATPVKKKTVLRFRKMDIVDVLKEDAA